VALWSRLLQALPDSRLIMAGVPPGSAQQHILARFAAHGIAAARLELHPKLSHPSFRELHHRIDIALDAFPHNGNTTTCESLWMGVPVISLIGDRFVARFGYTLLRGIGLADLAARDEAAYLAMATGLAADLDRLDALRAGMRARIASSALRDEAGFTRDLEAAYRAMWSRWCET
jgi:predicted O-linked N-acetylglucosamine transferase (SPINDLY family)